MAALTMSCKYGIVGPIVTVTLMSLLYGRYMYMNSYMTLYTVCTGMSRANNTVIGSQASAGANYSGSK